MSVTYISPPHLSTNRRLGQHDTTSPTFVAKFHGGAVTRMTTYCAPDDLDLRRGIVLSRLAYQTRKKGKGPPPIVEARFQTMGGDVLCEYGEKTIKQIEPTDEPAETLDVLATMIAEIDEAVEMMRPHFSDESKDSLRRRAESLRAHRYNTGSWPDFAEIARKEAKEKALKEAALKEAQETQPEIAP